MDCKELNIGDVIDLNIGEKSTVEATVVSVESVDADLFPGMSDIIFEINGKKIKTTCHGSGNLSWFNTHADLLKAIGLNE